MDIIKNILLVANNKEYPIIEHFFLSNIFDDHDSKGYLEFFVYSLNCLKFTLEYNNEYCEIYNDMLHSEFKKIKEEKDRNEVLENISNRTYFANDTFTSIYLDSHIFALEEYLKNKPK